MTRDEVMLMARLSEAYPVVNRYTGTTPCYAFTIEMLESFAYRVAEKERGACAQTAEQVIGFFGQPNYGLHIADKIRARGQK
jgi:hypothetical protein